MASNRYKLTTRWRERTNLTFGALTSAERVRAHRARERGEGPAPRRPGRKPAKELLVIPASPGADRDYPLDFLTPLRHVATELERAGRRGASLEQLSNSYRHPNSGDLSRIQAVHGCRNEADANRFLIDRALSALGAQLRPPTRGYGWRLAVPFDDLR